MTADTAARKDEQPVKGLDSLFAPFSILPRQRAVSAKPTRREQQIVWISHGIPTAVWTVRHENVQETLAGFRLPLRHGQSMASALREFAHFPFPDSQPGESKDTRFGNSHGCCRSNRVQRFCVRRRRAFFDREQSPYGIVLTLENKRDRNKTITGKAHVFRLSGVFNGLFSWK